MSSPLAAARAAGWEMFYRQHERVNFGLTGVQSSKAGFLLGLFLGELYCEWIHASSHTLLRRGRLPASVPGWRDKEA